RVGYRAEGAYREALERHGAWIAGEALAVALEEGLFPGFQTGLEDEEGKVTFVLEKVSNPL
ncbi:MAG: hypothetical protein ABDH20_11340, partial [Thermus sp.]